MNISFPPINPDMKDYLNQRYTIKNPDVFSEFKNTITSYWFGFLCADGYLGKARNRIKFELSAKDKDRLKEFVKVLGLNVSRIEEFRRYYRYKGKLKHSDLARIEFSSKEIAKDMENLGFREMKDGVSGIPNFIKGLVNPVKNSNFEFFKTNSRKLALAWLLGFYDGDGTYLGGNQAKIYSSDRKLLEEIKYYFGIENNVHQQTPPDKYEEEDTIVSKKSLYFLTLGKKVFELMMSSYKGSMKRKRSL